MQKILKRISSFLLAIVMCLGITAVVNTATVEYTLADAATSDYYSPVTATSGTALLGQLHDLITTTHTKYTSYSDCSNPAYVKLTDPGSSSSYVKEFYSQADISSTWGSGAVGTWNREHVWCQSLSNNLWGETGGGADMHHIRPAESQVNSTRGNNKFGIATGGRAVYYAAKNALAGYCISNTVFEPIDEVKGDVARIVMYVYTHYNTYSNVGGKTNGSGGKFGTLNFTHVMYASNEAEAKKLLLEWNKLDPVDESEIIRNEEVFKIQGNRNPFIDNEEYADAIWGNGSVTPGTGGTTTVEPTGLTLNPSSLNLTVGQEGLLTVTVTPSNATKAVTWTTSNASVATVSGGTVTAKAEGTATITATSTANPGITATARVTVTKAEVPETSNTITIDINSFSLSSGYGFQNWSSGGINGTAYIFGGNTTSMQFNTNNRPSYYLASTSPSATAITSVTVKLNSGNNPNWKLLTSTSAYTRLSSGNPTNGNDWGTKSVTASGTTWTVSGDDTYFALVYEGSGACYVDSIVVTFAAEEKPVDPPVVDPPQPPTVLESLEMHPDSYTLEEGESVELLVTASPAGANDEVIWSSSNTAVATVSDGLVTAVKAGTATITATSTEDPSIKATCTVTVTEEEEKPEPTVELESITLSPSSVTLIEGESTALNIICTPSDAQAEFEWACSDVSVAQVAQDGTVMAKSAGTATITVTCKANRNITATASVIVEAKEVPVPPVELAGLEINHTAVEFEIGDTIKLTVTATPSDADASVVWESSDTSVVTVSSDGLVTAVKAGTATITATSIENPSIKVSCTVTVKAEEVVPPPAYDIAKVKAFEDAVAGLITDGTLTERLASINVAINAYNALSDADKEHISSEDVEYLQSVIDGYNEDVNHYNQVAQSDEQVAWGKR